MVEGNNLIKEFVDEKSLNALDTFLASNSEQESAQCAALIADVFGMGDSFSKASENSESESKLTSSFTNNLMLLIQKTWIEKSDEELKAQVLYHLEEFTHQLNARSYTASYAPFLSIVDDVVYLMFGNQTKSKEFGEYALRIDPEFGIFWWYVNSLPRDARWSESKSRTAILLGMYFLANY